MGAEPVSRMVKARYLVPSLIMLTVPARGEPGYTGSKVCAGCHRKIFDDYMRSAMGRSMSTASGSPAGPAASVTVFSQKLNRYYQVFRDDEDVYQSEYELDAAKAIRFKTTHKLEYVLGSGVNGQTYIVRRGNHLFQAPLSYYAKSQKWDLSPGYEIADYGFSRTIHEGCIACHSGRPQPVTGRDGLYREPPFIELAIGCENCHGPGQAHAGSGKGEAIVNPAKLPARLAEDICMNCHQTGDTRVLQPGKRHSDFRPGAPLNDTVAIFKIPLKPGAGESDLLEHHFSMKLSRCFRESGERLSCLTCHNPHAVPAQEKAAAYYRSKCLACHRQNSCKLPAAQRVRVADDCVSCHMPKREVAAISHAALTNHRIVSRPGEALPAVAFEQTAPDLGDLIYLNRPAPNGLSKDTRVPELTLLRAYGELMEKQPEYQQRYLDLLERLGRSQPDSPLVQAALGRRILRAGDPAANDAAIEHLTKAVDLGFSGATVYEDLAEALSRAGRLAEAVKTLERGIDLSPYSSVLYKSLALRYITLKRYSEARKTMVRYMELFPQDDFMRGLLEKVTVGQPRRPQ